MDEAGSVGWFSAEQRAGLEDFWRVFDAHAVDVGLSDRRAMSEALARYEQQRNARAIPENEANLQAATLEGWDTPEAMGLRAALRDNPAEAGQFYAARLQVIPPEAFFAPQNLGRIMTQWRSARLVETL